MSILKKSKNWVMTCSVRGKTGEFSEGVSLEAILTTAKVQTTENDVIIPL